MVNLLRRLSAHPRVKQLGPGLITGAADGDPSGIATYSQAGAQFGYSMLWTVLVTYPPMVGIQMVSARLGCISGRGLAANVKAVFPRPVLYGIVGTGLLAVPVLAGSAADAVSESFDWQWGLDMKVREALEFYAIIAVPIMAIMMLLARREDVMGRFVISQRLRRLGWVTTGVMAVTVVAMVATL